MIDIIVCGGGSTGIATALTAAMMGMRVIFEETYGFLGGAATVAGVNGLGRWQYDIDEKLLIRRIPMEIMPRLSKNGGADFAWIKCLNSPEISREVLPYIFL